MFPGNELSSTPVVGRFFSYYSGKKLPNEDYCRAGLGVNDSSRGLNYQLWKGRLYPDGRVTVAPESSGYVTETLVTTMAGANKLSIAFDNNMSPVVCAIVAGALKLYWYDSTIPGFTTTTIASCRDALARIDDVRDFATAYRDIIVSYVRSNQLFYRLSRDRYTVEYLLADVHPWQRLYQCGMTDQFRFQFSLVWDPDSIGT